MRGEGNHKIPGSFAPENMEKTGAERVKYSLACQHEDAISIKFVSYAQKCPTVLCTFAVALRKESVDRNYIIKITGNRPAAAPRAAPRGRLYCSFYAQNRHLAKHPQHKLISMFNRPNGQKHINSRTNNVKRNEKI